MIDCAHRLTALAGRRHSISTRLPDVASRPEGAGGPQVAQSLTSESAAVFLLRGSRDF
jgi:hypothetical protein